VSWGSVLTLPPRVRRLGGTVSFRGGFCRWPQFRFRRAQWKQFCGGGFALKITRRLNPSAQAERRDTMPAVRRGTRRAEKRDTTRPWRHRNRHHHRSHHHHRSRERIRLTRSSGKRVPTSAPPSALASVNLLATDLQDFWSASTRRARAVTGRYRDAPAPPARPSAIRIGKEPGR